MESSYNSLSKHIRLVKVKNTDGSVKELLGINIDKFFMPSVANIVGTDLSKYQIVRKNQFACNRMHVGRDYRIPVAKSKTDSPFIVSPAYDVFEVIDETVLLPDYLMLWFKRREFDRNAWFYTDGDVRGGLNWKAFINMQLPIPSPEKQKELIEEYEAIENRIQLNKKLCATLEETAQTIYKHWFEDFEFPDENGKPYKSSGGEMVECEELGKEIPRGWRLGNLGEICKNFDSKRIPLSSFERKDLEKIYPYYGASSILDFVDKYIFDGTYVLVGEDGTVLTENGTPILQYVVGKFWVNNHAHVLKATNNFTEESLFLFLKNKNITNKVTGAVQLKINQANLLSINIIIPEKNVIIQFNKSIKTIFEKKQNLIIQIEKLEELKSLFLGKMAVEM